MEKRRTREERFLYAIASAALRNFLSVVDLVTRVFKGESGPDTSAQHLKGSRYPNGARCNCQKYKGI